MDRNALTNKLTEEFDTSRSEAERVSDKAVEYVQDKEESELTEKMKDPDYIPSVLRSNTSPGDLISRWDQWIGQFTNDNSYQIR